MTGTVKKKKPPRNVHVVYVRGIPAETKSRFKAYCAKHNISIQDAVAGLMRMAIAKDKLPNEI
jgi:plasmid stability protein